MPEATDKISLGPWFKGVDYSRPASELDANTLFACENVRVGNAGQGDKRQGSAPVHASAINSGATVTAIGQQKFSASSSATFGFVGNKFYEDIAGTPTDRSGSATITAGNDNTWSTVNADGTMIGHNGVSGDTIVKWTAAGGNLATLDVDSRFTTAKWVEYWDRRAWWANLSSGKNRLWYGDTDDIETYGALAFYSFDDDLTGVRRMRNGLVIHTAISLTSLQPSGNADVPYFRNDVILGEDAQGGSLSGRAIVNVPGFGQMFPRRDGIYAFTGSEQLTKVSDKLDGERYWDNINADRLSESFAVVYPNRSEVWFWLPYGSGQTAMNHAMILNYRLSRLVGEPVWYGPFVDLTRNCGALIDDKPHFGDFAGFIHKHDNANVDDDGTTENGIDAFFETSSPAPFGGAYDVKWKTSRTFYEVKGAHNIEVQEQSPDIAAATVTINMGGVYDAIETAGASGRAFTIEVSAIAGDDIVEYADNDLSGQSPFKRLRFRNGNANEPFSIRKSILTFNADIGLIRRQFSGVN
jgi:hypothetical protein